MYVIRFPIAMALSFCGVHGVTAQSVTAPVATSSNWFDDHTRLTDLATVLSMFGGVIAFAISTTFVVKQMRETQRWNVRKTSEEILSSLLTGDFPRLMDRLVIEFGWDILAHTRYEDVATKLSADQVVQLDVVLRNILRHLEVVCINMKNKIIDEEMCFDYLRSILTTFYLNCDAFISKERKRREEQLIFRNTEHFARKWLKIIHTDKGQAPNAEIRKEFTKAG